MGGESGQPYASFFRAGCRSVAGDHRVISRGTSQANEPDQGGEVALLAPCSAHIGVHPELQLFRRRRDLILVSLSHDDLMELQKSLALTQHRASSHDQLISRQCNATFGCRTATAALQPRTCAMSAMVQSGQTVPPCVNRGGSS